MNFVLYNNFIRKLSARKLLNFLKVELSYCIASVIKKPLRLGHPWSISVELTNYCNLSCPQCPVGLGILRRPKGFMSKALYQEIIDQSSDYLLNLFLYFQGEPYLHPKLFEFIQYAHNKQIFTALSTNGHFLSEKNAEKTVKSGLDKIIISIDGLSQETFEKYRKGGNLNRVEQGIKNLVKAKARLNSKTPFIELQFLVLKTNEKELGLFKKYCKSLGADKCSLKTAQIEDFSSAELFIPTNTKYSRYAKINGRWQLKRKLKNRCHRLWNSVVITWDGWILPCCYDKQAHYKLGRVGQGSIYKAATGKRFSAFANRLLHARHTIDICRNCNE